MPEYSSTQKLQAIAIVDEMLLRGIGVGSGSSGSTTAPISRTPTYISTSTTGTIAAGAQSIAIANIGNAAGTVMGVSLPAGGSLFWSANGSDTLAALNFDATGTTFLINTVT